jgi:hypothetical protein
VKGKQVNIPVLYQGDIKSGNTNDLGNIGRTTKKSSLFFLTTLIHMAKDCEINLFGETV